jgi:hypothetical protein
MKDDYEVPSTTATQQPELGLRMPLEPWDRELSQWRTDRRQVALIHHCFPPSVSLATGQPMTPAVFAAAEELSAATRTADGDPSTWSRQFPVQYRNVIDAVNETMGGADFFGMDTDNARQLDANNAYFSGSPHSATPGPTRDLSAASRDAKRRRGPEGEGGTKRQMLSKDGLEWMAR